MEQSIILIDNEFLPAAHDLLLGATKRIYISTFKAELTTKPRGRRLIKFFELMIEKSRLGLDVRVLISKSENYGHIPVTNVYAIRYMKEGKIQVRHLRNDRLCHAKIIIVDDNTVIIGSHNLGVRSCHNNFEISFMCKDSYTVGQMIGVYQAVWDDARKG